MSHFVVLLALLWYALVPAFGRTSTAEGPSIRAHRSAIVHAITGARTTTREAAREEAPSPCEAVATQPVVAPAASFRRAIPVFTSVRAPYVAPVVAVARGPPSR